jgi:hypothetical protein
MWCLAVWILICLEVGGIRLVKIVGTHLPNYKVQGVTLQKTAIFNFKVSAQGYVKMFGGRGERITE